MLRVWPGGINMTRTLGDAAAEGLLIPEPAVRQVRCGRRGGGQELCQQGARGPYGAYPPLPAELQRTQPTA